MQCTAAALSLGFLESTTVLRESKLFEGLKPGIRTLDYWSSLVTSCSTLLAWARAAMPVWLRTSYFDMLDVAEA